MRREIFKGKHIPRRKVGHRIRRGRAGHLAEALQQGQQLFGRAIVAHHQQQRPRRAPGAAAHNAAPAPSASVRRHGCAPRLPLDGLLHAENWRSPRHPRAARGRTVGSSRHHSISALNAAGKPIVQLTRPSPLKMSLRDNRRMRNPGHPKHPLISLNLFRTSQHLLQVIGEFHRRPAVGLGELADQADGIEPSSPCGLQPRKSLVSNVPHPALKRMRGSGIHLLSSRKSLRSLKIRRRRAVAHRPAKIRMKAEDLLHIQGVRSDEQLLPRRRAPCRQPRDVFVTRQEGIFAVDALARPIRHPIRCIVAETASCQRYPEAG